MNTNYSKTFHKILNSGIPNHTPIHISKDECNKKIVNALNKIIRHVIKHELIDNYGNDDLQDKLYNDFINAYYYENLVWLIANKKFDLLDDIGEIIEIIRDTLSISSPSTGKRWYILIRHE